MQNIQNNMQNIQNNMQNIQNNDEQHYIERHRERDDKMDEIRFFHFKWMTRIFQFLFVLLVMSVCVEVLRLSADDHAEFQYAYNNPPEHCFTETTYTETQTWDWLKSKISYPFKSFYKMTFEPPVASDCAVYFRKTNPMLLYLPRIPQAISNAISNFFLTPFVVFLDKFGDALRNFLDKFNVAERFFGIIILLAGMVLSSICFICIIWMLLRQPVPQLKMIPSTIPGNRLTYQEKPVLGTRRSVRLLQKV
jgi:hypothetical protein